MKINRFNALVFVTLIIMFIIVFYRYTTYSGISNQYNYLSDDINLFASLQWKQKTDNCPSPNPEIDRYCPNNLYFNLNKPAYTISNNASILPPSARITGRKLFKVKPLVIFATEWHMTPIKDITNVLTPFGVEVIDYNLDPWRCAWHDCNAKKNLKVLNSNNVLDIPPPVPEQFYEAYKNDSLMKSVDVVFCGYPADLCEIYLKLNKSVLVLASTRYDVGRYTPERWNLTNLRFIALSRKPWNVIGGNSLYDAEYIKYYTGINTRHMQSICDYTGAEYNNPTRPYIMLRRRDRGFNGLFRKEFDTACKLINCTVKLDGIGGYDFKDLVRHKGIVHVPYQISVMSIFEQYRMNMPQIIPSADLLAEWQVKHFIMPERTFDGAWRGMRPSKSIIPPHPSQAHVPDPKNENDFNSTRYWMEFADFYQVMPHSIIFNSIPHLVQILEKLTVDDLLKISAKMRLHNIEMKKRMLTEWRDILIDYAKNSPNKPH